jgi:FkbM family methyltransferase
VLVRGHRITLRVQTPMEWYRADTYATKEPETLDWLDRYVQAGDVVFDVGANIGLYSLYAAIARQARVYAFEPEAHNLARLQQHILLNDVAEQVTPYALALADREAVDLLHLSQVESGAALHAFGRPRDAAGHAFGPAGRQGVFGTTLDRLTTVWSLPMPHHLKIDVDGLEPQIIAGATWLLQQPTLRTILMEVQPQHRTITDILTAAGFAVRHRVPICWGDRIMGENLVAVRAMAPEAVLR